MDNYRVNPNLPHQNNVARKAVHRFVTGHRMTTQFNDNDRVRITLQVRQRLGQGAGGSDPITVHILFLHFGALHFVGLAQSW